MNLPKTISRTLVVKSLWLLFTISLLFVVGITSYKVAQMYGLITIGQPELQFPKIGSIQSQLKDSDNPAGDSNPFDATAQHWNSLPKLEAKRVTGPVRGIMLLPDVSIALTAEGPVKTGSPLAGGILRQINARQLTIDSPGGTKEIEMPAKRRPGMAQLNKVASSEPSKEKTQ